MKVNRAHHGKGFSAADRKNAICLDVLDAWFPPSPEVIAAYSKAYARIEKSPELDSDTLRAAICKCSHLAEDNVGFGAGSSEIIHRVFGTRASSKVLLLDPTYSEYRFVAEARGLTVHSFALDADADFRLKISELITAAKDCSDIVLVNPNNPTGTYLTAEAILQIQKSIPPKCLLWVDEAYIDYCPTGTSVESFAGVLPNLIVIRSLSKSFALSGLRAAYWVGKDAKSYTVPPWIISQPAQACLLAAFESKSYYEKRWQTTTARAEAFANLIRALGFSVWNGRLNSVLIKLREDQSATKAAQKLADQGLIVRTPDGMGDVLGEKYIRVSLPPIELEPLVLERLEKALN